jgi:CBS domain-containing protein
MKVQSILDHKGNGVPTIHSTATVWDAIDRMRQRDVAALVVEKDDTIMGIVSERDVVNAVARFKDHALSMAVKDVAAQAITIAPNDSIKHAASLMRHDKASHLIVIEDGNLLGIINNNDILAYRVNDLEMESNVLHDIYFIAR